MKLLAIQISPQNVCILTVFLISGIFASCAMADLRSDNFDDNSQASTWTKFERNPDACWINEVNQRLEITSNVNGNSRPALYITKDYGFITTDDFQVKINFYNSIVSWNWNELFLAIGFRDGLDNFNEDYIYIGAGCDMNNKIFWYQHVRDRQSVASDWKTRTSDSGTLYISYDASQDELYLSDSGYGSTNAWKTFTGVLQSEWAGRIVGVGIGGNSKYVAMSSGQIYLDNFVIDSGTLCTGRINSDLNEDCTVNFKDLAILVDDWLDDNFDPVDMVWVYINDPGVFGHEPFIGEMSKYETTNAQYCQFLNSALASGDITVGSFYVYGANGSNSGEDFVGQDYYYLTGSGYTFNGATNGGAARINYSSGVFSVDSGFEDHPVTYVYLDGATAFCNYYGYRLPTEGEWEAVAAYVGSYYYGCGTSINNSIANYFDSIHPYGTTTVGAFGTYGYGMCDMAGNVFEWTSSCYPSDCSGNLQVACGGWWASEYGCRVTSRLLFSNDSASRAIGFRVCR